MSTPLLTVCLVFLGTVAGGSFAALTVEMSWAYFIYGSIDGACISILASAYMLLFARGPFGGALRRSRFLIKTVVNTASYIGLFFLGSALGHALTGRPMIPALDLQFLSSVVFAIVLISLVAFLLEMAQLVGPAALLNFVRGTYHWPKEEDRVFLFVDLAGSTALAEKLGNQRFLMFLNRFFSNLSEASPRNGAEIYKYVGDEAILSWDANALKSYQQAIKCFFQLEDNLEKESKKFMSQFGELPKFRGSIHRGHVIVGELGDTRKELAYIGDVMNVAARLMEEARKTGSNLVASGNFVDSAPFRRLRGVGAITFNDLGELELKGKQEAMRAYQIQRKKMVSRKDTAETR